MTEIDIQFFDCTEWEELSWFSSGGTRSKTVLQDKTGSSYYFKRSEKKAAANGKPEKYYKHEFWNEIIAFQLGKYLGLDILRYDVAMYKNELGCLSPNMIANDHQELIEIGRLMTEVNPEFLPVSYENRKKYTFQLLIETLTRFDLQKYLPSFLKTIIFDALLGNTDRHQENWAFIAQSNIEPTPETLGIIGFAPIYDCGSCLAREQSEKKVLDMLNDQDQIQSYINKGLCELYWNGEKKDHFTLINNLLISDFSSELRDSAAFLQNWNPAYVKTLLKNIDNKLPDKWQEFKISENRKQLMLKLLTSRYNLLFKIFNDRI